MNMRPVTKSTAAFSLDKHILRRIAELARADRRSKSGMVEVLLDLGIKAYEQERQPATK